MDRSVVWKVSNSAEDDVLGAFELKDMARSCIALRDSGAQVMIGRTREEYNCSLDLRGCQSEQGQILWISCN